VAIGRRFLCFTKQRFKLFIGSLTASLEGHRPGQAAAVFLFDAPGFVIFVGCQAIVRRLCKASGVAMPFQHGENALLETDGLVMLPFFQVPIPRLT
jgi:hypothetical protein